MNKKAFNLGHFSSIGIGVQRIFPGIGAYSDDSDRASRAGFFLL